LQPGPSTFTASDYVEFVIEVGEEGDGWWVTATRHPSGETLARVLVDLNTVRSKVPRLFRAWKAQGRFDDAEQARLLGQVLYRSIIPNAIATELARLMLEEKRPVHVSLCFDRDMDADLVHLPWEQLYVEGRGTISASLGVAQRVTLTRVTEPVPTPVPPPPDAEPAVLLVTAPRRQSPLEVREIYSKGVDDLQRLHGLALLDGSAELNQDDLQTRVEKGGVSVLHYIGFGRYDHLADEIALAAGDDDAEELEYIRGEQLAQLLFQVDPPKLVILQTCAGPASAVPADPTVLAPRLLGAGVQAVVAFPYPLTVEDAALASRRLYEELVAGESVRVAVQEARRALRRVPWSRPALFMRSPADVRLVSPSSRQASPSSPWGG
jgi:hypothetical protein